MKPIAQLILILSAALSAGASAFTFTATGTISPVITGVDPFGNPWIIAPFGPIATWRIPASTTPANTFWLGPDCLLEVRVSATALTASGPVSLAPLPVQPNFWRNYTDAAIYDRTDVGNEIRFTQPGFGALVTGDEMGAMLSFLNPSGYNTVEFNITYITEDKVPEPAGFALVGSGLAGLGLLRRRGALSST